MWNENKSYRVGIGLDIHKFSDFQEDKCKIKICGEDVPHTHKVIAHSDGDVGLHALTDAILGALAEGNIGVHFPNTDPKWKDADSSEFIKYVKDLMKSRGAEISNVDITIICEAPKIMPHSLKMRNRIADLLSVDIGQVSVKATTSEKIGFLGRKEGIAAQAICSILLPIKRVK